MGEISKQLYYYSLYGTAFMLIAAIAIRGVRLVKKSPLLAALSMIAAAFGVAFAILATLSARLPKAGLAPPKLGEDLIRITAIGSGVVFLLLTLVVSLPLVLNLLEGRSFTSFVAARHVRATKSGFLTVISVLSILGVALSSCALCSVTSIMGGFGHDLKRKILANHAHVMVDATRPGGFTDWRDRLGEVRAVLAQRGGGAATPVVGGDAMASSASNTAGALVRGVDPETIGDVIDLKSNITVGQFDYFVHPERLLDMGPDEVVGRGPTGEPYLKGPDFRGADNDPAIKEFLRKNEKVYPSVILGKELAKSLHVLVGDEVSLLSPMGELGPMGMMPRTRRFRVAAIFYSGMYEYDATHAYILLPEAQAFFSMKDTDRITNIDVRLPDSEKVKDFRPAIGAAMDGMPVKGSKDAKLRVRDWQEMNKNLFSALKLEKIATFIILSLAILVASFCIVCTLLLMVTEKSREIAILKALGAANGAIMRTFMIEGMVIGGIGTVFGVGTALATCLGLMWFGVRLDPEVYYINRLPVNVNAADYALVALASFLICTISTLYPAYAASEIRPVEGLRSE